MCSKYVHGSLLQRGFISIWKAGKRLIGLYTHSLMSYFAYRKGCSKRSLYQMFCTCVENYIYFCMLYYICNDFIGRLYLFLHVILHLLYNLFDSMNKELSFFSGKKTKTRLHPICICILAFYLYVIHLWNTDKKTIFF